MASLDAVGLLLAQFQYSCHLLAQLGPCEAWPRAIFQLKALGWVMGRLGQAVATLGLRNFNPYPTHLNGLGFPWVGVGVHVG